MERERAIRLLKEHEGELRRMGVSGLALFGSTARGDAQPDSDVDVLIDVEPDRKFSLIDQASVHLYLSDLFGRNTDVAIREDLRPRLRKRIQADEIRVF